MKAIVALTEDQPPVGAASPVRAGRQRRHPLEAPRLLQLLEAGLIGRAPTRASSIGSQVAFFASVGASAFGGTYVHHTGDRRMGEIRVTNHGPGDAFELDIDADDSLQLTSRTDGEFPVPRLLGQDRERFGKRGGQDSGGWWAAQLCRCHSQGQDGRWRAL